LSLCKVDLHHTRQVCLICSDFPDLSNPVNRKIMLRMFEQHVNEQKAVICDYSNSTVHTRLPRVFLLFNTDIVPSSVIKEFCVTLDASEINCSIGVKEYRRAVQRIIEANQLYLRVPPVATIETITKGDMNKTLNLIKYWQPSGKKGKASSTAENTKGFGLFEIIGKILYNKRLADQEQADPIRYSGLEFEQRKNRLYFNLKELLQGLRGIPYGLPAFSNIFNHNWPLFTISYKEMSIISTILNRSHKRYHMGNRYHVDSAGIGYKEDHITKVYIEALGFMTTAATPPKKFNFASLTASKRHPTADNLDRTSMGSSSYTDQHRRYKSRISEIMALCQAIGIKDGEGGMASRSSHKNKGQSRRGEESRRMEAYRYLPGELPPGFGRSAIITRQELSELDELELTLSQSDSLLLLPNPPTVPHYHPSALSAASPIPFRDSDLVELAQLDFIDSQPFRLR
jgi:hypothetical protein